MEFKVQRAMPSTRIQESVSARDGSIDISGRKVSAASASA